MAVEATPTVIAQFTASPLGQWMSITGWVVGVLGAAITLRAYWEQRRRDAAYAILLDSAEREWKGRYSEEQVVQLSSELSRLRREMSQGIPVEARRAVARDQMDALETSIVEAYERYTELGATVEQPGSELPEPLKLAIESELRPRSERRSEQLRLIALLVAVVLLFSVMPLLSPLVNGLQDLMQAVGMRAPESDLYAYLTGLFAVALLSGDKAPPNWRPWFVRHRGRATSLAVVGPLAWLASTYWLTSVTAYPVPDSLSRIFEVVTCIVGLAFLWLGLKSARALLTRVHV